MSFCKAQNIKTYSKHEVCVHIKVMCNRAIDCKSNMETSKLFPDAILLDKVRHNVLPILLQDDFISKLLLSSFLKLSHRK